MPTSGRSAGALVTGTVRFVLGLALAWSSPGGAGAAPAEPGAADRRVAVVVGNADYRSAPLDNPLNDAALMAEVLAELGFEVVLATDLEGEELHDLLPTVAERLEGADVGLFYYAGHAMQHRGVNILLPVDLEPTRLEDVVEGSLSILDVIDTMAAAEVGISLVFLDACRNNPFVEVDPSLRAGLASVDQAPGELLIGYAASAGQFAFDSAGYENSPYTAALAAALEQDDWHIDDLFRYVRREVREATGGLQIPWVSGSLETDLVLRRPADRPDQPGASPTAGELTVGWVLWQFIRGSRDPAELALFVEHFPASEFVSEARSRIAMLEGPAEAAAPGVRSAGLLRGIERYGSARGAGAPSVEQAAEEAGATVADDAADEIVLATTGDRFPPDVLRLWSRELQPVPGGLAGAVTECDLLAADPDDPGRVAPGVRWGLMSVRAAVRACAMALADEPENPRLLFQFARALDVAKHHAWAEAFYERSAERGYGAAFTNWGYLYKTGRGRPRDDARAAALYRRAADLGNPRARTNLGSLYLNGEGVPKSVEEGLAWFRLVGAHGWPNALTALGDVYRRGRDVPTDYGAALELYRAAADLGQTDAMQNLGRAYLEGWGVEPDAGTAVRWLERATDFGNEYAPYHLGRVLRDGSRVPADPPRAAALFQLAAERGYAEARLALADLHRTGALGRPDLEAAYFEYRLAVAAGVEGAGERLDALAAAMPAPDRARAEARARDWLRLNGP